jgi:hypothetical protein
VMPSKTGSSFKNFLSCEKVVFEEVDETGTIMFISLNTPLAEKCVGQDTCH